MALYLSLWCDVSTQLQHTLLKRKTSDHCLGKIYSSHKHLGGQDCWNTTKLSANVHAVFVLTKLWSLIFHFELKSKIKHYWQNCKNVILPQTYLCILVWAMISLLTQRSEQISASPGRVPLLATYPAMSTGLLSIWRSFIHPMNSRVPNGKLSGTFGTPPRNNGPVRSKDLRENGREKGHEQY